MAAEDLTSALDSEDVDGIWYSIQAFLVAAGNVSKLLWPAKPHLPSRGGQLQQSLSVSDESPLEPRAFRDHFEHFDERLEVWANSSQRRNFVDSNIGPPGMIAGIDIKDFLRNFDPTDYTVTFRGDSYHLRPVISAIRELWEKAAIEADKPLS